MNTDEAIEAIIKDLGLAGIETPQQLSAAVKAVVAERDTFKRRCCQMEAEQAVNRLRRENKLSSRLAQHELNVIMKDLDHFGDRMRELRQRYAQVAPDSADLSEGTEERRAEGDQGGSPKGTKDGDADVVADEEE